MLICCLLVGITAISSAQTSSHKLSAEDKTKQLQKELNLTDSQTTKISAIYKDASVKLDSLITAAHGNKDVMMKTVRPLGDATDKKIKAVLTPQQATQFDKLRKERIAQSGNGWAAS